MISRRSVLKAMLALVSCPSFAEDVFATEVLADLP